MSFKVLVTGGSGFIGTHVVDALLSTAHEPLIFDRRARRDVPPARRVESFLGDTTDDVAVMEAMAHSDGFIHLAGVLGTQETIQNPRPSAVTNILGGINVLEAAAHYGVPGVYLSVGNHWMDNPYSISKTAVERYVRMYNAFRGARVNVVRAMNVYGEGQQASPPFGPSQVRKIAPAFICRALSGAPLEIYGDGLQVSDMVYVKDVAEALLRSLHAAAESRVFDRVVEIGPSENTRVNEVAELVRRLVAARTGRLVDLVHLPMRPGETPGSRVSADVKTLELVGMAPESLVPLADGMARTIDWYREHEGAAWRRP